MITTTLNRIKKHDPCIDGWTNLLKHLGKTKADDEPLPFTEILKSNGLADTLWCCRVEPDHDRLWRLYAVWCARQAQHLMPDQRSITALDVAEQYANGKATVDKLKTASADAYAANANAAAYDSAADSAAAYASAASAAASAASAAYAAAYAAAAAAASAVYDAAATMATANKNQCEKFLKLVTTGEML
jgi:hypothetical protein